MSADELAYTIVLSRSSIIVLAEQDIPTLQVRPSLTNPKESTPWLHRLGKSKKLTLLIHLIDCNAAYIPLQDLFAYLLMTSISTYSIRRLEYLLEPENNQEWLRYRDGIVVRVNNMVVVGSLVITCVFTQTPVQNTVSSHTHALTAPLQSFFLQHRRTLK